MITLTDDQPIEPHRGDSITVLFPVTDLSGDAPAPLDLIGATITAAISVGGRKFVGVPSIVDAAQGELLVTWAPGLVDAAGEGIAQVRVSWPDRSEVVKTHPVVIRTSIV